MQESTGTYDLTHTPNGSVMDMKVSHLPVSFSAGQTLSNGYQRRAESALNSAYSEGSQLNQSWDQAHREMVSLDQHMGSHSGANASMSTGIDTSTQQSMQTVRSAAQSFGKRYGMSESRAMSLLANAHLTASGGGDIKGVGLSLAGKAGVDYSGSADKSKMIEDAMNISSSKDFSESMSQLQRFSKQTDFHEGQDAGKRLSETLSTTFDQSNQLNKSIGQHLSASESYSKSASYAKDNSARMDQNHNDAMWESFVEHVGGQPSEAASIYDSKEGWAREVVDDFHGQYFQKMETQVMKDADARVSSEDGFYEATATMTQQHDASIANMKAPNREVFTSKREDLKEGSGLIEVPTTIQGQKRSLDQVGLKTEDTMTNKLTQRNKTLQDHKSKIEKEYKGKERDGLSGKSWDAFWNTDKFNDMD